MHLSWDPELLQIDEFAEKRDEDTGRALFRGIAPAIGIAWGRPTSKKPLQSTGRADYFGPLPNRAARCMASAAVGQVLVDGEHLNRLLGSDFPPVPRVPSTSNGASTGRVMARASMEFLGDLAMSRTADGHGQEPHTGNEPSVGKMLRGRSFRSTRVSSDVKDLNEMALWDAELRAPHRHFSGSVSLQGMGLFKLKGIADPVSLAQAWAPELNARAASLPTPANCIVDLKKTPDPLDEDSSLTLISSLPASETAGQASVSGPAKLTRHLSGFFSPSGDSRRGRKNAVRRSMTTAEGALARRLSDAKGSGSSSNGKELHPGAPTRLLKPLGKGRRHTTTPPSGKELLFMAQPPASFTSPPPQPERGGRGALSKNSARRRALLSPSGSASERSPAAEPSAATQEMASSPPLPGVPSPPAGAPEATAAALPAPPRISSTRRGTVQWAQQLAEEDADRPLLTKMPPKLLPLFERKPSLKKTSSMGGISEPEIEGRPREGAAASVETQRLLPEDHILLGI